MDELDCDCKRCTDISEFRECVRTHPCPNETARNSFCYWKPHKMLSTNMIATLPALSSSDNALANAAIHPHWWGSCDCCKMKLCPPRKFFDHHLCTCRCQTSITCSRPRVLDPNTCHCVCPRRNKDCGPNRRWNRRTCHCECKHTYCFQPRILNVKTCECACLQTSCVRPFEFNQATCGCECPKNIVCRKPKILNRVTCRCDCPVIKCPLGKVQDPDTCQCVCNNTCPRGARLNPVTCKCNGICSTMYNERDCHKINSCRSYPDKSCR